ncbi:MAG: DUF4291 domain-containing protein [Candidatus Helarchaeota archaeon]
MSLINIITEKYVEQLGVWPKSGKHILAQYDQESIVVYQAYGHLIGDFATKHGYFGGSFKLNRMSWIKPNFLWMMYRSGWGTKEGQEVVLAIRIKRSSFESILEQAVHSTFIPEIYKTKENWKRLTKESEVRLQWDPDHDPSGKPLARRVIQLGLKGTVLKKYSKEWIIKIINISNFVKHQFQTVKKGDYSKLIIPKERVYRIKNEKLVKKLGLN